MWLRYVMESNTDAVTRIVLNWKPEGKRPCVCPRKRWMAVVKKI